MRRFLGGMAYLAAGILAGAASAYVAIESAGVEPMRAGSPWTSRAAGLDGAAAVYVRSYYLMEGRLPPASGQLAEAVAENDEGGQPLQASCRYRLTATGPLPRWWSLAVLGGRDASASRQSTADVDTVVRDGNGELSVVASQSPQPGNWLKSPDARRFAILYSAALPGSQAGQPPPFTLVREACP